MGFLSGLLKTVAGAVIPGLFADKPKAQAPLVGVKVPEPVDLGNSETPFWKAYIEEMRQGKKPVTFDANAALQGGGQVHLQQFSNRYGGMSSSGASGVGLMRDRLGPGRGAGGSTDDNSTPYQEALRRAQQKQSSYAQPFAQGFQNYMGSALAGQSGLPQEAYSRALLQGQSQINQQTQLSRQQLQESLGSRGLLRSGLMSRGLADVERAKLGAMGTLTTGLAGQQLQAQRESQRFAAAMYPQLVQMDVARADSQNRNLLALRQLELQAEQLGISRQQLHGALQNDKWSLLAGLGAAYYLNQGGSSGGGAAGGGANNLLGWNPDLDITGNPSGNWAL